MNETWRLDQAPAHPAYLFHRNLTSPDEEPAAMEQQNPTEET